MFDFARFQNPEELTGNQIRETVNVTTKIINISQTCKRVENNNNNKNAYILYPSS